MLISDVGRAFTAFRDDYNDFKIIALLERAVNLLSQKGATTDDAYAKQAENILSKAEEIADHNAFQHQPDRIKNIVLDSAYAKTIPNLVAAAIIRGVSKSQREGISSSEAQVLLDAARNALAETGAYLIVLRNVGASIYAAPEKDFDLSLYFPSDLYQGDLSILSDHLARFDKFFATVAEIFQDAEKPKLTTVSDGSLLALLIAAPPVLTAIAKTWSAVMQAAIDTIKLKNALGQMREVGMPKEVVEAQAALIDQHVLRVLHDSLEKQFSAALKQLKESDANAVNVKIRTTASALVEDAQKGARLTLEVSTEVSQQLLNSPTDPRQIELAKLIEHQRAQDSQIASLTQEMRRLPPPSA